MSVNSSSFGDFSPSNSSLHRPYMAICFRSEKGVYVFTSIFIANLLLLPLFILILYVGYQQRKNHRNVPSAAKISHSDLFIYHSIGMQLNEFLGFILFFCGGYTFRQDIMTVGLCIWSVNSFGEALFHLLACVERYLAVVHPITYLGLRQTGTVKIRNTTIACIWLLCVGWMALLYLTSSTFNLILYFCIMISFLFVIAFCSISVLWALKRPGPGEVGGNRARVDQSKRRAFHTIVTIMGVLLFRFGGNLICNVIGGSAVLNSVDLCLVMLSAFWFYLPSSLVLPLLFLHRAGKLLCC